MLRELLVPVQRIIQAALPSGGTAGQVLRKASNSDNDVEWADAASGSITVDQELNASSANAVSNAVVTDVMSWHNL